MITGKVAALIDERTLVINKGANDGVKKSMRFMVLGADGKRIVDPDTKKELGSLKIKKLNVEVIEVEPSYSIAETYKYTTVNKGGTNAMFSMDYLSPPKYVKKYETFSIQEQDKKTIDEERSVIKVGDLLEQIQTSESTS